MPDERDGPPLVVVVGAGVTGMATAWHLQQSGAVRVVVLDGSARVGGKIMSATLAGADVDAGPDSFLARVPWAVDLCRAVGLDDLVAPATTTASIWSGGRLRRLPDGLVLGVPTSATALARSRLLSPAASLRAATDLVRPRSRDRDDRSDRDDPSVADVIGDRLGRGVVEQVVEPLLGGINAGVAHRLSLRAVAPQIAEAAASHRSVILGLRAQRRANPPADGPVFLAPRHGMTALTRRLHECLQRDGVEIRTNAAVTAIAPTGDGRVAVSPTGPRADHLVLATPAHATAPLVAPHSRDAASLLDGMRYASIAIVLLAYRAADVTLPPDSGFLVPRTAGRLLTACSFLSNKWPHLAPPEHVVVRASVGHIDDRRGVTMSDAELVDGADREVRAALTVSRDTTPTDAVVIRWPDGFPQYEPGHADRVARVRNLLSAALPNVSVAGAAYDGLGLAACARQGAEAARRILSTR